MGTKYMLYVLNKREIMYLLDCLKMTVIKF